MWITVISISSFISIALSARAGPSYVITSPNVFHYDTEENVAITINGVSSSVPVRLYLQDYPDRRKTFSQVRLNVNKGSSQIAKLKVTANNVEVKVGTLQYVYLVAESNTRQLRFRKEAVILLTPENGYVFLQPDKPIYTPDQEVKYRVFSMNEDMKPSDRKLRVKIISPQGVIVDLKDYQHREDITDGIADGSFRFPSHPLFGNWSIVVLYGPKMVLNKSVTFEVREYVLPTFSVKIQTPKVILPGTTQIKGSVHAKYVYGKAVEGTAMLRFGVAKDGKITIFGTLPHRPLAQGVATFDIRVQEITKLGTSFQFPRLADARFHVEVVVTERVTGNKVTSRDKSTVFAAAPYKIHLHRTPKFFKPGLPFDIRTDIGYSNGGPLVGASVELRALAKDAANKLTILDPENKGAGARTNPHGQVTISLPRVPEATKIVVIRVEVKTNEGKAATTLEVPAAESVSNSYLYLRPSKTYLKVGSNLNIEVFARCQQKVEAVNYFVFSRGQIVSTGSSSFNGGNATNITLPVAYSMSPSIRVVAFYKNMARSPAEIIADSVWLDVEDKCLNTVKLTTSKDVYHPGEKGTLEISGSPGSRMALLAVDRSVYLLHNRNTLTSNKMFSAMESYDVGCGPGGGRDGQSIFQEAGLAVLTNAGLQSRKRTTNKCGSHSRDKRSVGSRRAASRRGRLGFGGVSNSQQKHCCSLGSQVEGERTVTKCRQMSMKRVRFPTCRVAFYNCCIDGSRPPPQSPRGRIRAGSSLRMSEIFLSPAATSFSKADSLSHEDIIEDESELHTRTDFPESWMFDIVTLDKTGHLSVPMELPDAITTWVIHGVGVSTQTGMCVASPRNITAFKKFFIQLELPYSVIKGEQIQIQATVFNYENIELPVTMYLDGVKGICSTATPGQRSEAKSFKVRPNDAYSVTYPIVPLDIGEYTIKVMAFSAGTGDIIKKQLRVVPEGIEKILTHSLVLDPAGELKENTTTTIGQVDGYMADSVVGITNGAQFNRVDVRLPKETIPGSEKCKVSVTGKVIGPSVPTTIDGITDMVHLPTGCGEQTAAGLAANVYVLKYLKKTGQMTKPIKRKTRKFIKKGIAKQLGFRKQDGSFAMWTNKTSSSWLTAFTLKVFSEANAFAYMDKKVICSAIEWLAQRQRSNGAYYERYKIHKKEMTGGMLGDPALTAFVLIAMLEADCPLVSTVASQRRAVAYLEGQLARLRSPYAVAIVAYALALADSSKKLEANEKLKSLARHNPATHTRYWLAANNQKVASFKPYWYRKKADAISVETTGYALLAQLAHKDMEYSKPIVLWLMKQRNSRGAFVSTQDTVVSLQALAKYNARVPDNNLHLHCNLSSEADNTFKKHITVTQKNAHQRQVENVPHGGHLFVNTAGTGIGQMQVEARFNIPSGDSEICKFDLTVASETYVPDWNNDFNVDDLRVLPTSRARLNGRQNDIEIRFDGKGSRSRFGGRRSRIGRSTRRNSGASRLIIVVKTCARYLVPGDTGMAIMHVGLFSGFEPITDDLRKLKVRQVVENYEVVDRAVIFYLKKIPSDFLYCVKFRATRKHVIGNTQPVAVKVYDYYEPDDSCIKFYHPTETSPLLSVICEGGQCVCAEGNCATCYGYGEDARQAPFNVSAMITKACHSEYAFRVEVKKTAYKNSFEVMIAEVKQVFRQVKSGPTVGSKIEIRKKMTCFCPRVEENVEYLVMGKMGFKYVDSRGQTQYLFVIDEDYYQMRWYDRRTTPPKTPQQAHAIEQKRFVKKLQKRGCR